MAEEDVREKVSCPKCNHSGSVYARKDAYADHALLIVPGSKFLDWEFEDTAIMDNTQAYECFSCNEELDYESILEHNGVEG